MPRLYRAGCRTTRTSPRRPATRWACCY